MRMSVVEAQGWAGEAGSQAQLLYLLIQQWSGVRDLLRALGRGSFEFFREKMALLRSDKAQGVGSEHFHPLRQQHLSPLTCASVRGSLHAAREPLDTKALAL